MVMGNETVVPVEENHKLIGVVKLVQVLSALGDKLISPEARSLSSECQLNLL